VHLTETCDPDRPHLITDVQTTLAPVAGVDQLPRIQADLAAHGRLPDEQVVDAGYISTQHLLTSQQTYGIDLVGPVNGNHSWQARAQQGYAATDFTLDWQAHTARCPEGQTSVQWVTTHDPQGHDVVTIRFATAACQACAVRVNCTWAAKHGRVLSVRPQAEQQALRAARVMDSCVCRQYAQQPAPLPAVNGSTRLTGRHRGWAIG